MRLQQVATGQRFGHKLLLKVMRLMSGMEPPDVVKMLLYRKDYFGGPYGSLLQDVLRGPSAWTVGERELFAAFASRLNHCSF